MGHHHSSPKPTTVVNNGTVFNPHATNDAVVNANNIGLQNLHVYMMGGLQNLQSEFYGPQRLGGLQLQNLENTAELMNLKTIVHNAFDYKPTAGGKSMTSLDTIKVNAHGKNDSVDYDPNAKGAGYNYVGKMKRHGAVISGIVDTAALMNLAKCSVKTNRTVVGQVTNDKKLAIKSDAKGNLCVQDITNDAGGTVTFMMLI